PHALAQRALASAASTTPDTAPPPSARSHCRDVGHSWLAAPGQFSRASKAKVVVTAAAAGDGTGGVLHAQLQRSIVGEARTRHPLDPAAGTVIHELHGEDSVSAVVPLDAG